MNIKGKIYHVIYDLVKCCANTVRRNGSLKILQETQRLPVKSSRGHLVTRSTRHKRAHKKAISRQFFYLHAGQVAPR